MNKKGFIFDESEYQTVTPIILCEKCGQKYLFMARFKGKCYLCINKLITFHKNEERKR